MSEPTEIYKFQKTNVAANNNKWYTYEVYDNGGGDITVVGKFGRVGDAGQVKEWGRMSRSRFEGMLSEREHKKGYKPIKLHRPSAPVITSPTPTASPTTNPTVVELLELIFSEAGEYIKTYLASSVDALSQEQIAYGRSLLLKAQNLYKKAGNAILNGTNDRELAEIVEEYYNVIPTQLPRKLDYYDLTRSFVRSFDENEDRLNQLEAAIATMTGNVIHPNQTKLQSLGADVSLVDRANPVYNELHDFATRTAVHGYRITVENIFEVHVPTERSQYENNKVGAHHKELLFHGTATRNVRHILRTGLICPATYSNGRMFGNGIYFANKSSKSMNYCSASSYRVPNMLLIGEVALGNMYVAPHADHFNSPPHGYDSVWGKAGVTGGSWSSASGKLQFDEFIVYKPAQQTLRYLITFRK